VDDETVMERKIIDIRLTCPKKYELLEIDFENCFQEWKAVLRMRLCVLYTI